MRHHVKQPWKQHEQKWQNEMMDMTARIFLTEEIKRNFTINRASGDQIEDPEVCDDHPGSPEGRRSGSGVRK